MVQPPPKEWIEQVNGEKTIQKYESGYPGRYFGLFAFKNQTGNFLQRIGTHPSDAELMPAPSQYTFLACTDGL